jgi:macrodomain Ter protein organizer (MatP/YcbG family)
MKKFLLAFSSLSLLFLTFSYASAQNLFMPEVNNQQRVRVREENKEIGAQVREEKREMISSKLEEAKVQRIRARYGRLLNLFNAHLERLATLADRVESRLDQIDENEEDIDTDELREMLEDAREKIALAQEEVQTLKDSFEELVMSENPGEAYAPVKDLVLEMKGTLKEIRMILVEIVTQIKGLRIGVTNG